MTDIAGLLHDRFDESTLIPEVNVKDTQTLIDEGIIAGGMIPEKLLVVRILFKRVVKRLLSSMDV